MAIQQRLQDKPRNAYRELFEEGDLVNMQDPLTRKWGRKGEVVEKLQNSDGSVTSYKVQAEGRCYHRSARHLMKIVDVNTPTAA